MSMALMLAGCTGEADPGRVVGELAAERIELTVDSAEPIVAIDVAEGETVRAGQRLLRQDDARATLGLAQADAALARAEARLAELVRGPREEAISVARANLDGALRELAFRRTEQARIAQVFERQLTSRESLDSAQAALDAAEANASARRAALDELLAGTTVEELQQAEQTVHEARAQRDAARVDVERASVVAPIDAVVDTQLFEVGERPQPGQPVMVLLPDEQPHARVYVSEGVRVHLAAGDAARVFVDGLDRPLQGRLRWISTDPAFTPYFALTERDRGRLSYMAKVDITEAHERLPEGVPVEVVFSKLERD